MDEQEKRAIIHPWIYYIAPLGARLIFTAFCKACRQYYTEEIPAPNHNDDPTNTATAQLSPHLQLQSPSPDYDQTQ